MNFLKIDVAFLTHWVEQREYSCVIVKDCIEISLVATTLSQSSVGSHTSFRLGCGETACK